MKHKRLRNMLLATAVALCGTAAIGAILQGSVADGQQPAQPSAETTSMAPVAEDQTATWDFSNSAVMEATVALSGSNEAGTVKAGDNAAVEMTVVANGAAFRNNGDNIQMRKGAELRIPVQSTEDVVTVKGYPGYSYYTIGTSEEYRNDATTPETVYKAKNSDVQQGYVSVVSTNDNNYFYSLKVDLKKPKQLAVLDGENATATFVFDLGTEKQKAAFSNEDYFLASKVEYGSNLTLDGKDNKGNKQTWFGVLSKQTGASADNVIKFMIQPKHGLVFTPTKVSLKSTRYGTGGGRLDIAWLSPDGSTVKLDSNRNPARDNETPNVSEYSYAVSGAATGEGSCGIQVNLYSLDPGKRVGFADIVIEGTLSGTEKEVPMLASFSANGVDYNVDDIFEANGEEFTATIELASSETMISAENPVTNVTPISGEVGTITYEGDNDHCAVTMPVVLNGITINYVANFVRKPIFTLSYYDTDGSLMGTQQVEKDAKIEAFAVDYATAKVSEGKKVRGWFAQPTVGRKVKVDEVITDNLSVYAVETAVEVQSSYMKYLFDLTNQYFYPEDHEAFNTENGYFHDTTHGWAFKAGDKIDLLVGKKATIMIGLCRYGYGTEITITDAAGTELGKVAAKSADGVDGEIVAFNYEGEGGYITLNLDGTGEMYLHNVKIINTEEVTYDRVGQWFYVKAGDAQSFLDVIEAVSAANTEKDSPRSYVFIPDGVYDLEQTVLTTVSGHNISLIGQSQKGTIIRNAPHYTTEGISTTATLVNTGTNLYMQDLTLQNALDYYATIAGKQVGGRAVAWWDKGINTICKNVTLLSYQDTYYSNNLAGRYYWTDSEVHGTVDFFCGEGTMFMENSTIVVEKRNADGSGGCTLTAPSTAAGSQYGYVFSNCNIKNYAANYNLGRAWSNEPRCAFINTTVDDKSKIVSSRWTTNGMNVAAKSFVEYNTMDEQGNVVSPATNVLTFIKGTQVNTMETILTAEQAAEYTVDKVFADWNPAELATQVDAPAAVLADGMVTWEAVEGALGYAVYKNNELAAIVMEGTQVAVEHNEGDVFTIRAINQMGGHGVEAAVTNNSGVTLIGGDVDVVDRVYYNLQGIEVDKTWKGVVVIKETLSNGNVIVTKGVNR